VILACSELTDRVVLRIHHPLVCAKNGLIIALVFPQLVSERKCLTQVHAPTQKGRNTMPLKTKSHPSRHFQFSTKKNSALTQSCVTLVRKVF
jgi:hypothetical protein